MQKTNLKEQGITIIYVLIAVAIMGVVSAITVRLMSNQFAGYRSTEIRDDRNLIYRMLRQKMDCCNTLNTWSGSITTTTCTSMNANAANFISGDTSTKNSIRPKDSSNANFGTEYTSSGAGDPNPGRDTGMYHGLWNFALQCVGLISTETGGPTVRYLQLSTWREGSDPTNKVDYSTPSDHTEGAARFCSRELTEGCSATPTPSLSPSPTST